MYKIYDFATWQERVEETVIRKGVKLKTGKFKGGWAGEAHVGPAADNSLFEDSNQRYKEAYAKLYKQYKGDIPFSEYFRLQDEHRIELTKLTNSNKPKLVKLIPLATRFNIIPGSDGWEDKLKEILLEGKHLGEGVE